MVIAEDLVIYFIGSVLKVHLLLGDVTKFKAN